MRRLRLFVLCAVTAAVPSWASAGAGAVELQRVRAADEVASSWLAPAHRARVNTAGDPAFETLARSLRAPGGELENPCLAWAGRSCLETPLDPFFTALDELSQGEALRPVVVSAFGNSLIASDRIVDRLRARLVRQFGNGGRGLLLVDRMANYGPRTRTGTARGGWEVRTLGELEVAEEPFGLAGVFHRATRAGASSRFRISGERKGALWWLDGPQAAAMAVWVDGRRIARTTPERTGAVRSTRLALPPDARTLEVIAEKAGAVALGVVLEHQSFGIVVDTIGVPSADATYFLRADEQAFKAQLAERAPRLNLFILGGNETKRLEWRRTRMETVEKSLRKLLRRSREAAPESACMVVGPIDAVRGLDTSTPGVERPWLQKVNALQRRVALSEGCAYFDLFAAMGGSGAFHRFEKQGLVHEDLVHPRGRGLDLLGELLADAVLRAYSRATTPRSAEPLIAAWRKLLGERDMPPPADAVGPSVELPSQVAEVLGTRARGELLRAVGVDPEALRPLLTELGWIDPSGAWTARGGWGVTALLMSAADSQVAEATH